MTELWAIGLTLLSVCIGAMAPILLKKGAAQFKLHPIAILKNKNFMAGTFLYGAATVVYIPALRGGELSVIFPLISLGYCVVPLLSVFMLGEKMNWMKWSGIACVIIGVSVIGTA